MDTVTIQTAVTVAGLAVYSGLDATSDSHAGNKHYE
jgi:hypothetical protein